LVTLTASGGTIQADATGQMSLTAISGAELNITAGTGLTAAALTSTTGKIDVDTTAGNLSITTASAKTQLDAQSVAGALTVGTYTADTALLRSGTDMGLTSGTVIGSIDVTAGRNASLGQVTSTTAKAMATSGGTMAVTLAKGSSVALLSGTGLTATTIASTAGDIDAKATTGAVKITTATATGKVTANAMAGDLSIATFNAGSADLNAGNDMSVTTGSSTNDVLAVAGRNAALGSLTSTAGKLQVDTTGTLKLATGKAANEVDLSGRAGVTATTLSSTNAFVDVDSLAGSVSVSSANAKTYFNAKSYGAMTVGTFAVTAGWAKLITDAALTITTGNSTDYMQMEGGTNVALGTLTSSGAKIDATAKNGGISFATLRAASKSTLNASKAWNSGQAINGTAMYVSSGGIDLLAASGGITVGTLSGTGLSVVRTNAGSVKITSILGFSPANLLTITATGGTKTVPLAYR
jgi:hypothetical protein